MATKRFEIVSVFVYNMTSKINLSTKIFHALKQRIIRWGYPPGHRLTEEAICQEFSVSRVPVREALRMLAESGLVEMAPHRGCTVKQPNLVELHELYDVRLALELFIVAQLAESGMAHDDWKPLYERWASLAANAAFAVVDSHALAHEDAAFHEALARATGNRLLYEHLRMVDERLFFTRMYDITTAERLATTSRQHVEILTCISRRDGRAAQEAVRTNIDFGRGNVEAALKEALAQAHQRQALRLTGG